MVFMALLSVSPNITISVENSEQCSSAFTILSSWGLEFDRLCAVTLYFFFI
jgi:hypothetical protein